MIPYEPPAPASRIPVIDLGRAVPGDAGGDAAVAWEIHKACRETGFFYVSNHGVPDAMVAESFVWARRFFALPMAEKLAIHMRHSATSSGYEPVGGQVLDSQDDSGDIAPPDLKEAFYVGMELPAEHPWSMRRLRGYGHNQWPGSLPGFRAHMLGYRAALDGLGDRLLGLLALSLELPADWFARFYDMPSATLRLLRYPPHPAGARANQLGAGAHTDWGGITLLAQDDAGGLEVRNVAGQWIEAPPVPGTFVVNLGDLMARWTNGLYSSTMHRVMNAGSGRERYSIPYFYSPRADAVIEAMPGCVDAGRPPRYASCTAEEHMGEMFRRSYGYTAGEA